MDAVDDPSRVDALERHVRERGLPFFRISAVAGNGLDALLEAMWRQIAAVRETARSRPHDEHGGSAFSVERSIPFMSVISMQQMRRATALALDEIVLIPAHDQPLRPIEPRAPRLPPLRAGRAGC